jgi:acyl-CoA:acyl-CoA alkyltransferase
MVLGRGDLLPAGHRYLGGVSRAATAYSHLCRGTMRQMVTDTRELLAAGLDLASKTFDAAKETLGWQPDDLDEFVVHQVSKVHTAGLVDRLGIDPTRVLTIFDEYGNIGPASVPVTLSKLDSLGRLRTGSRVALMGIGSGLNCTMAEIVW